VIWRGYDWADSRVSRLLEDLYNVTPKGLPPGARVQNLRPSPHKAATAYVPLSYRFLLGDFAPIFTVIGRFSAELDAAHATGRTHRSRHLRAWSAGPGSRGTALRGHRFGMYIFSITARTGIVHLNLPPLR